MTRMHEWETVARDVHRLAVPGGWLYGEAGSDGLLTYVPDPTATHVRYAADPWEEAANVVAAAEAAEATRREPDWRWYKLRSGASIRLMVTSDGIKWAVVPPGATNVSAKVADGTAPTPADAMRAALAAAAEVAP